MSVAERPAASDGDADCGTAGAVGRLDKCEARSDSQTALCAEFKQRSKEKSEDVPRDRKGNGRAMGGNAGGKE